jgi:hypothetical protein
MPAYIASAVVAKLEIPPLLVPPEHAPLMYCFAKPEMKGPEQWHDMKVYDTSERVVQICSDLDITVFNDYSWFQRLINRKQYNNNTVGIITTEIPGI